MEDEITLGLNFAEGNSNLFKLNGKLLQLVHPLDRDKENLSHIQFTVSFAGGPAAGDQVEQVNSYFFLSFFLFRSQISCTIKSTPSRNRNIPIIVRVSDVNDNPPVFVNAPYETSIAEVSLVTAFFYRLKSDCQVVFVS